MSQGLSGLLPTLQLLLRPMPRGTQDTRVSLRQKQCSEPELEQWSPRPQSRPSRAFQAREVKDAKRR